MVFPFSPCSGGRPLLLLLQALSERQHLLLDLADLRAQLAVPLVQVLVLAALRQLLLLLPLAVARGRLVVLKCNGSWC